METSAYATRGMTVLNGHIDGQVRIRIRRSAAQRLRALLLGLLWLLAACLVLLIPLVAFLIGEDSRWCFDSPWPLIWLGVIGVGGAAAGPCLLRHALMVMFSSRWITREGIQRRLPWWCRLLPWTDVHGIERDKGFRLLVGRGSVLVPARASFVAQRLGLLRRLWRQGVTGSGRRRLPTVATGPVGPEVAILFLLLVAIMAASNLAAALAHRDAPRSPGAAAVLIVVGAIIGRYVWRHMMWRHYMTCDGMLLRGRFRSRRIGWGEVRWIRLSRSRGDRAAGKLFLQGRRRAIGLAMPLRPWRRAARFILSRCEQAFLINDSTGAVVGPKASDEADLRDGAVRLARRIVRRYVLHVAAGGTIAVSMIVVALLLLKDGYHKEHPISPVWDCLLSGFLAASYWAVASLSRARRARESLDRIVGLPPSPNPL